MAKKEIIGYKGFNKDMTCRGFKYEQGKTYKYKGKIILCEQGFHFCKNPLDVISYYDLTNCIFHKVKGKGKHIVNIEDSKVVTNNISIGAKLNLSDFITASVNYLLSLVSEVKKSSGYNSKLASNGYNSQLASNGYISQLASSGDYSQLASSGDYSKLASSGYNGKLASSGYYSKLASSGANSILVSSGANSQLASSGANNILASSGYNSKLASSGANSQLASNGKRG